MKFSAPSPSPPESGPLSHSRLSQTATFRAGRFNRWSKAAIALFGAGALGGPLATGIVRSGASVGICDFDVGEAVNLGTQQVDLGLPKAVTIAHACDSIRPGRARSICRDVRHVGIGILSQFDLFIDATDDANLALPIAELSNGLAKPMLRVALDGNGDAELGRVLCSSAGTGHACSICSFSLADLQADLPRTGCPDQLPLPRRPTIAGGAMSMTIAGLGLLSAQRIVTGNDAHLVLGREVWVDWSNLQVLSADLPRSDDCLSGHVRWDLEHVGAKASTATLRDLFRIAESHLGSMDVTLEPYLHPLRTQAACACGRVIGAIGTQWATPPVCSVCDHRMVWCRTTQLPRLDVTTAADLGVLETPLVELGMPEEGAMLIARTANEPPLRLVLESAVWLGPTTPSRL